MERQSPMCALGNRNGGSKDKYWTSKSGVDQRYWGTQPKKKRVTESNSVILKPLNYNFSEPKVLKILENKFFRKMNIWKTNRNYSRIEVQYNNILVIQSFIHVHFSIGF